MRPRTKYGFAAAALAAVSLILSGCSGTTSGAGGGGDGKVTHVAGAPSWCGTKKITFALLDGFGGNSWRLVTTASGRAEAAKCPSVTKFLYADGQGNTSKAISDIKGMASRGVNAMVVFPDAGKAVLPALTSAYKAGVVTVPYRVDPGGKAGVNYDKWIGDDFANDGHNWATWIKKVVPNGGNILFMGGPAGNSQSVTEYNALKEDLGSKYTFVQQTPFVPTNWDPTLTQTLLSAAIAKNPKIDVIVSDFGPTLVSSLPLFTKNGKKIPALATSDGNSLACFWQQQKDAGREFPLMTVATGNDNVRLAVDYAIAKATGGKIPTADSFKGPVFEDSTDSSKPVQCKSDLPGDVYLSAQMPGEEQAKLGK
ncbi:substrate-binding domain-containing protein [Amnibacterium kyonggiense]|uniref:Ribose transport system substrate-binding protein n=1 Tax=Amnibacterium kyonggiense TaxID=595671 RepID=A0A4R7FFM2_9MICO|nr:substrate-binding domain-containing protein [Amnibacterium kyonggiense]TDS75650.1 ribose transport system substrate-binding protein [Amnibacterium kyonggiense]